MMDVSSGNIFRWKPNGSMSASVVASLLLVSGIEPNPGPLTFIGAVNARRIVQRGPLIQDLITSHNLDALAVCESWIVGADPDAVKFDAVPPGFRVHNVPRSTTTRRSRGCGLCFIHRDSISVNPHPTDRALHLVRIPASYDVDRCRQTWWNIGRRQYLWTTRHKYVVFSM